MQIMGVAMVRADPKGTPPQPVRPASTAGVRSLAREPMVRKRAASPPAFAGEGAEARGLGRSHKVTLEKGRGGRFGSPSPFPAFTLSRGVQPVTRADASRRGRGDFLSLQPDCGRGGIGGTHPARLYRSKGNPLKSLQLR